MNKLTMLDKVRNRMASLKGEALKNLATDSGMSYDTALRIREGRTDPPFSQVQKLAEKLKLAR